MIEAETPPIAALFQVVFDQKVGYTIAWKRSLPGVELDGVEYQCLPSGLHSVSEDLVYFTHGSHAGISAFVQEEADKQHRNASFVAVGALVSLDYGRLGRGWVHADALRGLARKVIGKTQDAGPLEQFWEKHNGATTPANARPDSAGKKRKRTPSDADDLLKSGDIAEPNHPSLSIQGLLTTFGPLIFPLHRAALLRKRILLIGSPPVQTACNFVYDLSILSNLPESTLEIIQTESDKSRLYPLFNVGVFDISQLESRKDGWIACTTDEILGEKKQLYDLCVELPSAQTSGRKMWPKLRSCDGTETKASQRDLRRYGSLRVALRQIQQPSNGMNYRDDETANSEDEDEEAPLVTPAQTMPGSYVHSTTTAEAEAAESESWSAAAYRSIMWWASAGEMEAWEAEEASLDQALLKDLPRRTLDNGHEQQPDELRDQQHATMAIMTYFRRLISSTFQTLADIVEEADDQTEEGIEEDAIVVTAEELRRMGVDTWSAGNTAFVVDAMKLYFKREASIGDQGLMMCGVRIC